MDALSQINDYLKSHVVVWRYHVSYCGDVIRSVTSHDDVTGKVRSRSIPLPVVEPPPPPLRLINILSRDVETARGDDDSAVYKPHPGTRNNVVSAAVAVTTP